nr:hypothetical protein [Streptococcus gallolyticus]
MKKINKIFLPLLTLVLMLPCFLISVSNVKASEVSVSLSSYDYMRLTNEVNTIYHNLIKYDEATNKFIVNETQTYTFYNGDSQSIQGVYLMKDNLNTELNSEVTPNELVETKISDITYVLQGNDINELLPPEYRASTMLRAAAPDYGLIGRCIKDAWGVALGAGTLKTIVNLFKSGRFEAAAAALASSTAGRIAGIAALFAFVATCGIQDAY